VSEIPPTDPETAIDDIARVNRLRDDLWLALEILKEGGLRHPDGSYDSVANGRLRASINRAYAAWFGREKLKACAYLDLANYIEFVLHSPDRGKNVTDPKYRTYEVEHVIRAFSAMWPNYGAKLDQALLAKVIDAWPIDGPKSKKRVLFYDLITKAEIEPEEKDKNAKRSRRNSIFDEIREAPKTYYPWD
jgi:hypothetical protein